MKEKTFETKLGSIHYWVSKEAEHDAPQLVFLPGLTADHRLFDKQIEYFEGKYPLFVWDAPGHAFSYPFELSFNLEDKAEWLDEILESEGFDDIVLVGQSMGGYLGQMYAQFHGDRMKGFVSIDSAPLKREYYTAVELWLLERMEPVYRHYPWKLLLKQGCSGTAESEYGRGMMHSIMMTYDGDQKRYAALASHGYCILAGAVKARLPYDIKCPALLICGEKDRAGSTKRYNRAWHKKSGIPIEWIRGAGHNSNTDKPDEINGIIEQFIGKLSAPQPEEKDQPAVDLTL